MGHAYRDGTDQNEIDQDVFRALFINRCKRQKLVHGDRRVFIEVMEQRHFRFGKGDFGELFVFLVFPDFEQDRVCH